MGFWLTENPWLELVDLLLWKLVLVKHVAGVRTDSHKFPSAKFSLGRIVTLLCRLKAMKSPLRPLRAAALPELCIHETRRRLRRQIRMNRIPFQMTFLQEAGLLKGGAVMARCRCRK